MNRAQSEKKQEEEEEEVVLSFSKTESSPLLLAAGKTDQLNFLGDPIKLTRKKSSESLNSGQRLLFDPDANFFHTASAKNLIVPQEQAAVDLPGEA